MDGPVTSRVAPYRLTSKPKEKFMEPGTVITITFEDRQQDFLQWDICNGVVIDCRPFQASLWVNCRLVEPMEALCVGHHPLIMPAAEDVGPIRIKYPLEAVTVQTTPADKIPCFMCAEDFPASIALQVEVVSKDGEHEPFSMYLCPICGAESA